MKKIYIYLIFSVLFPAALSAQSEGGLTVENAAAQKRNDRVYIEAVLDARNLDLRSQQMMLVTPVLRSFDRRNEVRFDPVLIVGRTRNKALKRAERLDDYQVVPRPTQTIHSWKIDGDPIRLQFNTPYASWMREAELVFNEEVSGCVNRELASYQLRGLDRVLPPAYVPSYTISYAEPPTEAVKQRSETYEARLNFVVNRYEIRHDYMNNAAVLDEVDKIIHEVKSDANLTINEFKVTGYASPEGAAAHNMKLSENRAKSFVSYVQGKHAISQNVMQVDWKGDDWDGLRKLMDQSNFTGKQQVLDILNGTSDAQQRKTQLRNLGTTYRALLDEYYPYLRRNEYTISYIARPFSVEEAKTVVRTKPQQLSLNEMYLVANTYPKTSREFKEVFDIAARLYPNDDFANLNSAALDIENGAYDVALERLMKVNKPEAWNNIGYIYLKKGDYTRAADYFKRASDAGLSAARTNLNELNRWLEDPE